MKQIELNKYTTHHPTTTRSTAAVRNYTAGNEDIYCSVPPT